jgi:hypothetical protein
MMAHFGAEVMACLGGVPECHPDCSLALARQSRGGHYAINKVGHISAGKYWPRVLYRYEIVMAGQRVLSPKTVSGPFLADRTALIVERNTKTL